MAVFEVKVVIPVTVHADSEAEAKDLAVKKIVFERKDITHKWMSVEDVKQTSMF